MTPARRRSLPRSHLAPFVTMLVVSTACAETTYDEPATTATVGGAIGTAGTTTVLPGSAAELLPLLAAEAEGLSRLMIDGGDDETSAERIAALWAAARQEVAASRPELLADFEANVTRCAGAVRFHRAADADKAAANLRALVDAYLA